MTKMDDIRTTRQPGEAPIAGQPADFDPVGEARALLRQTATGALATLEAGTGHPFASLVTVATDMDGSPILLLSGLSAHTKNIIADDRVSLLLSRGGKGDPLAHARLTVLGRAGRSEEPRLARRFLARHEKAALYADFPDFAFLRVTMLGGHLNGGFARAARLSAEELTSNLEDAGTLLAGEEGAVAHMNSDHADAIELYAMRLLGRSAGAWRMTSLDPEGADLAKGSETARLAFPRRVTDMGALRSMLVDLAGEARRRGAP